MVVDLLLLIYLVNGRCITVTVESIFFCLITSSKRFINGNRSILCIEMTIVAYKLLHAKYHPLKDMLINKLYMKCI